MQCLRLSLGLLDAVSTGFAQAQPNNENELLLFIIRCDANLTLTFIRLGGGVIFSVSQVSVMLKSFAANKDTVTFLRMLCLSKK